MRNGNVVSAAASAGGIAERNDNIHTLSFIITSQHFSGSFIKIRIDYLGFVEDIIFLIGFFSGLSSGDAAFFREDLVTPERQEFVDTSGELFHGKGVFAFDKVFDVIEEPGNGALQAADGFFIQVIFGDVDIGLQDATVRGIFHVRSPMFSLV